MKRKAETHRNRMSGNGHSNSVANMAVSAANARAMRLFSKKRSLPLKPSEDEVRKALHIKPSASFDEGRVVFIQRWMKMIREDRFRVSAADCTRVVDELEQRREGLHSLMKYCVFMLLFIAMLAMQKSPARALSVESSLRMQFENVDQAVGENWIDVSNFEELQDWIVVAIGNLHIANNFQSWGQFGLSNRKDPMVTGQISSFNTVLSGLVLKQTRGAIMSCEPQAAREVGEYLEEYTPYCYSDAVDKTDFGPPPFCTAGQADRDPVTGYINCVNPELITMTAEDKSTSTRMGTVWNPHWANNTAHATRFKYSAVSEGWVELIDLGTFGQSPEEAMNAWNELNSMRWLDKQTRNVEISILTYNANTGLYGQGKVQWKLNVGGVFSRQLAVESLVVSTQYKHAMDYFRLLIEICFFSWSLFSIGWEFVEMRNEGCEEYWSGKESVWNYIDWAAMAFLMSNLILWILIVVWTALWELPARPLALDAKAKMDVEKMLANFSDVNYIYTLYGGTNVISLLFMIIRLLKSLNYHPKLAIVSNTIGGAAEDLMHFSLVFIIVLCVYSFMGMVIAGRQMIEFATFEKATINLALVAMGEFATFEELYLISPVVGTLFFFSFIAIVTVLMMNIILSIVVESFVRASHMSDGVTSVYEDAALSITMDIHQLLRFITGRYDAEICGACGRKANEASPMKKLVTAWYNDPKGYKDRKCGFRMTLKKLSSIFWPFPGSRHQLLTDALAAMSEREFVVHIETPVKCVRSTGKAILVRMQRHLTLTHLLPTPPPHRFLKTTLKHEGVPEWATSIIVAKFVRPRRSDLTWGDLSPDWYPEHDGVYEPMHGHHEAVVRRRASLQVQLTETPEASMRAVTKFYQENSDDAKAGAGMYVDTMDGDGQIEMSKFKDDQDRPYSVTSPAAMDAMRIVAQERRAAAHAESPPPGPQNTSARPPPGPAPGPPPDSASAAPIAVVVPSRASTHLSGGYQKSQAAAQAAMLLGRKR